MSTNQNPLQSAREAFEKAKYELTKLSEAVNPEPTEGEDQPDLIETAAAMATVDKLEGEVLAVVQALQSVVPGGPIDVRGVAPEDVAEHVAQVQRDRRDGIHSGSDA
jgi:hypothetical protein